MSLPSHDEARNWPGLTVLDRDGDTVGRITHIYLDRDSRLPEWALVAMPERGRVFVPLAGAGTHDDRVQILVGKAAVREAPEVPAGRELAEQDETRLYRHYGITGGATDHGARRASASGRRPGGRTKGAANRLDRLAGGAATRLQDAGGHARQVATSAPAKRVLSAAGAASALGAAAAVAGRSGRGRVGLAGALDGLLAAPAAAFRRRRRRQRVRAVGRLLGDTVTAPLRAAGGLPAELGRRAPTPRPLSRRRRSKMAGNLKLVVGLATGYVLGTRAGRERYERLVEMANRLGERPAVQELAGKLRSGLGAGFEKATSGAADRLEQARRAEPAGSGERPQDRDEESPGNADEYSHSAASSPQDQDGEGERTPRSRAAKARS